MWRYQAKAQRDKVIGISVMGKKILIVDDEQDVVTYLVAVLESNDYTPYSANSVKVGLEMLERVKPDLICLDIMMPKESGFSMYKRLRKNRTSRNIPVMIISGVEQNGEFDFRSYVSDKSIPVPDSFMEKPIDVDRYLQTVKQLLSSEQST